MKLMDVCLIIDRVIARAETVSPKLRLSNSREMLDIEETLPQMDPVMEHSINDQFYEKLIFYFFKFNFYFD